MGIYLSSPNKTKYSENGEIDYLRFGVSSMQGWRMNMEDAHIGATNISNGIHLFAVFDGHGGAEVANFCKDQFVENLLSNKNYQSGNFKDALTENFLHMDKILESPVGKELIKKYLNEQNDGTELNSGCTANVVLLDENKKKMYIANAGDSRCILFKKDGTVEVLSEDHKPDLQKEKDRIQEAGGYIIEGRVNGNLNLSRAIGDLEYKKKANLDATKQLIIALPDVEVRDIDPSYNFFIIGCDGVWELLTDKEICQFVDQQLNEHSKNIEVIIENLLEKCLAVDTSEGLGCDNMSCIVVTFK